MSPQRRVSRSIGIARGAMIVLAIALVSTVSAFGAEGEAAGPPPLEFSFANPGARAMGLGGAFVALADDATAAFANPAGLVQLIEPEVSIELRLSRFETPFSERGRFEGEPSGVGIDDVHGIQTGTSTSTVRGVPFLSYVQSGDRWSAAIYRHELADFESRTATDGIFGGGSQCCQRRSWDVVENADLEIVSYGVAGAWRISERLSIGAGLQLHRTSVTILTQSFRFADDTVDAFFSSNPYDPQREVSHLDFGTDHSNDVGFGAGILWNGKQWHFGGVYRKGPEAELQGVSIAGPATDTGIPPGDVIGEGTAPLEFPDVYAVGAGYRTADGRLTAAIEWDRVTYSSILESIGRSEEVDVSDLSLEDADEIHIGVEYVFLASSPLVAIRAGIWRDPYHRAIYVGPRLYDRAILPKRDDDLHFTLGFGLAFKKSQIDIGVDVSDTVRRLSVSTIRTF